MATEPTDLPDGILLARYCARRDDDAFAALVERHRGMVRAVCRRIAGEADLDDCVQAVFLVLALRARGLTGRSDLGGWLHLAARHVALRQRATIQARRRREALVAAPDQVAPPAVDPDPFLAHIDAALEGLPEKLRQPIVLHYLEGLPADAVATRLGLAPKALGMRLTRGRRRLRALLERLGARVDPATLATLLAGLAVASRDGGATSGVALAKAAAALGEGGGLAREVATALAWAKAKAVAAATAAALAGALVVGGGAVAISASTAEKVPPAGGAVPHDAVADGSAAPASTAVASGDELLQRVRAARRGVASISGRFSQRTLHRDDPGLAGDVFTASFAMAAPDKYDIVYTKSGDAEYRLRYCSDGKHRAQQERIISGQIPDTVVMPVAADGDDDALRRITALISLDTVAITRDFTVLPEAQGDGWMVVLLPRAPRVAERISRIEIDLDANLGITSARLNDPRGNRILITIEAITPNPPLDRDAFTVPVP